MRLYTSFANVKFRLEVDNEIAKYYMKRIPDSNLRIYNDIDIDISCSQKEDLAFIKDKFVYQQEPDMYEDIFYREIFDVGIFTYFRKSKRLEVVYMIVERYPFNTYEVVVDTILQFMYLIMLEFNEIPLHAAVVAYEDKGALIFGNSGSGKTTLELSLLCNGLDFFSDDIAFLSHDNKVYSSGERIIACLSTTKDIIKHNFNLKLFNSYKDERNKKILNVDDFFNISLYNELCPKLLLFPMPSTSGEDSIEIISKKEALIELIKLLVSEQFNCFQKQTYFKRLRELSENCISIKYYHSNRGNGDLKEICNKIRQMLVY
jgi:hypothetical protein